MKDMQRLYRYKSLLLSRHAVPTQELMAKLGISIATLKRDMAQLREQLHIPVVYDRQLGGYRLEPGHGRQELPGLWLSSEELVALATMQQLIAGVAPGALADQIAPLQERLGRLLHDLDVDSERLAQRIRIVHAGQRQVLPSAFNNAAAATLARQRLRITHMNRETGQVLERVVSPQQLVHYRDNWYLDAWCHHRDALRSFAVDAITDSRRLEQTAIDVDESTLRTHTQSGYGIFAGLPKARARLRFSAQRARWVSGEQWHPQQVGRWLKDGRYELQVPYSDDRELLGDILRHGATCEVVSPKTLRERVQDALASALTTYQAPRPPAPDPSLHSPASQPPHAALPARPLLDPTGTLSERLHALHRRLLETVPAIDRIACALYNDKDDILKTFIHSTRHGESLGHHEYRLSESRSLNELARKGEFRVLDDIANAIRSDTTHSRWLLQQGYRSSFTVPIYDADRLLGFVFFDSMTRAAFVPTVQRDLVLYCSMIAMAISREQAAVRSVLQAARIARDLAEVRDFETGAHLERMARYSRVIARAVAPQHGLGDDFIENIYLFASLHDVGKIGIPDVVLLKTGKLSDEERVVMEGHVQKGIEIIDRIVGPSRNHDLPDSPILRNIVACHHEYLDGSGYPQGLRGHEIPLEARIVTVADIYDALTALRPYKRTWSHDAALEELRRMCQAGQLDADCVDAMVEHQQEILDIQQRYKDEEIDS